MSRTGEEQTLVGRDHRPRSRPQDAAKKTVVSGQLQAFLVLSHAGFMGMAVALLVLGSRDLHDPFNTSWACMTLLTSLATTLLVFVLIYYTRETTADLQLTMKTVFPLSVFTALAVLNSMIAALTVWSLVLIYR